MTMDRVTTGIRGFDEVLEGGFPSPAVILVVGEPGAGKTTMSMQTLFNGAKEGEKGLYITAISEPVDQVHRYMSNFSFYDRGLVDSGTLKFIDMGEVLMKKGPSGALDMIVNLVRKEGAGRVVVDPIAPFSYMFRDSYEYRKFLHEFFMTLKAMETLTILIAEFSPMDVTNPENYMADGVIFLYLQPTENPSVFKPGIQVRKMKGTEHTKDILRLGFTKDGMRIL